MQEDFSEFTVLQIFVKRIKPVIIRSCNFRRICYIMRCI